MANALNLIRHYDYRVPSVEPSLLIIVDMTKFRYPTLLHMAARYGLEELCRRLVVLPDAQLAATMASDENKTPEELAQEYYHYNVIQILHDQAVCYQVNT